MTCECCSDEVVETRAIETTKWNSFEYVDRVGDQRNVAQECYQQSNQVRRNDVERIVSILFLNCSSVSCGASGRGGVLGIELITITYGKEYNGITDDETCRQPESDPIVCLRYWGLLVGRVAARVLSGASFCTLPCLFGWSVDQGSDCPSPLSELMSQHGCHFQFDGS